MAKSAVQRRREADARKREQGLAMFKVWIRPEHKGKLKEFETEHQKEGGKHVVLCPHSIENEGERNDSDT